MDERNAAQLLEEWRALERQLSRAGLAPAARVELEGRVAGLRAGYQRLVAREAADEAGDNAALAGRLPQHRPADELQPGEV